MNNPWKFLKDEIASEVKKITKADVFSDIEEPTMPDYGDLSLPCFNMSKKFQASPTEISEDLAGRLKIKYITKIKAIGPYVNFYVDWNAFGNDILKAITKTYGKNNIGKNKKVMVEFSAVNTNKPLHIGHARNCAIGDSLANIMKKVGYKVTKANYPGDIGLHIAKTIYAYKYWFNGKKPTGKTDHFVGELYTLFEEKMVENPELEEKAREILRKWENGDKEIINIWKKINKWAIDGQEKTYKRLGIKFDNVMYESQFTETGKDFIPKLLAKGFAFKGETGEIVADTEKFGIPNFIILRSDGTSLYQTKELAVIESKFKKYKLDQSINVVGREQELYFQQVYKLLELLGSKTAGKSHHLAYGLVMLPEGKMSGRKGKVVFIDELLDDVKESIYKVIKNKFPKKKAEDIAEKVAIGAIKYALLKLSPDRNIMFNKEEIIRYEGDTGPYLQYTYARANSILNKEKIKGKIDASLLTDPREITLLKILAKYPLVLEKSARDMKPNYLANYLYMLTENFNNFYQNVPVLKAESELVKARLKLVESVKTVIESGLNLLGIPVLEKM
ncbi:MAG: arginine--tRNA ligase [Nanoarchaeota archaeon]|nr:arginine--tRNA ligase [Nanoarchaeota archaeon]MBU4123857.1 arginine--tRNA ligase [Nanoarchaeota archaeon]